MSAYHRLISYIYAYEGGIKGKNTGFAKLETRGTSCRIQVSVRRVFAGGSPIGVYLLAGQEEIRIGTLFVRGGNGEFRAVVNCENIEGSGCNMEECCGLTLHETDSAWRAYTTIWEDAVAHAAEVELADALGKSEEYVKKDLGKMIRKRLFLHGHLDKNQTCLMVTDSAYEQYQTAEKQLEERQQEEKRKAEEAEKFGRRKDLPEEAKKTIAAGRAYLEEIKTCNDRIPGVEISEKISRLELVISKIFNRVEQHPELVDDLGRFMDYYLPTTVKLLKAYEELDGQPSQGENIVNSKKEIEDTLDTIDQAFEKLLDSFFEEAAWDISSDISVLHNMFAQEGLTESDFDKVKVKR